VFEHENLIQRKLSRRPRGALILAATIRRHETIGALRQAGGAQPRAKRLSK
jgi:hypothetical protein